MPGKLRMNVSTKYVGCAVEEEIDLPDHWTEMTEVERDEWVNYEFDGFIENNVESDYHVVEDAE